MATTATPTPGVISSSELYTLDEFMKRSRLGAWAVRMARRDGLPILRIGRRGYVRGSDVIAYLDRVAKQEQPA